MAPDKDIAGRGGPDLGRERIGRLLWRLALPAVAAQVVNMLYNVVDRVYIGHIAVVGKTALTGVGVSFPVIMLVTAFSSLVGMGGAPLAAIAMGEGDNGRAERIMGNCLTLLLLVAIGLTAAILPLARPLLRLFGASPATLPYGLAYLQIYACGTVFVLVALGLNQFIATQGFARVSMKTVAIGAALNIALDPVFIFALDMGVRGAALATVIAQGVSCLWVARFLTGPRTTLRLRRRFMRPKRRYALPALLLGLSPFTMQSTEGLLAIVLNTSLLRYGGDLAVGAYTILASLMQMAFMPLQALGQAAQPITGFNYGAGNLARVRASVRLLLFWEVGAATAFWLALMLFPRAFIALFTADAELAEKTAWALRIFLGLMFTHGFQSGFQQSFVALGQAKASLGLALWRKIVLLIPLICILPRFFADPLFGVFVAEPVADALAAAVTAATFLAFAKKRLGGA